MKKNKSSNHNSIESMAQNFSKELSGELNKMAPYIGGHVDMVIDIIKDAYEKSHWVEFPMGNSDIDTEQ